MGRRSNTAERKAQIVDGFINALIEHGYHGATIQRIATASDMGSGLIHYHFKDKEAITLAAFERLKMHLSSRYERYLDAPNSNQTEMTWKALDAYMDAHLHMDEEDDFAPKALKCWVEIGALAAHNPIIRSQYQAHIKEDMEMLKMLIRLAAPGASIEQRSNATSALYAMITGAYHLAQTAPDSLQAGFAASSARHLARALLSTGET